MSDQEWVGVVVLKEGLVATNGIPCTVRRWGGSHSSQVRPLSSESDAAWTAPHLLSLNLRVCMQGGLDEATNRSKDNQCYHQQGSRGFEAGLYVLSILSPSFPIPIQGIPQSSGLGFPGIPKTPLAWWCSLFFCP